jgi:hypothetical protein
MAACFSGGPVVILDILYPQLSSKYGNFAVLGLIRCRILLIFEQNEGRNFDKNQYTHKTCLFINEITKKYFYSMRIYTKFYMRKDPSPGRPATK